MRLAETTTPPASAAGEHLNEAARAKLALSDEERIRRIKTSRWIGYTRAHEVLDFMEDLLDHPPKHRMPNLLLVGDTNNGKTAIVQRFRELHPPQDNPDGDGIVLPVLIVHAPDEPSEDRFYNAILEAVFAPYKVKDKIDRKMYQVYQILRQVHLRMLVIDEIHDIVGGSSERHKKFLKAIKRLGNELRIPLVGVGTHEAFNAVNADPQLANRFHPMILPKWKAGTEYLKLLASFESMIPLRHPSGLIQRPLATKLLALSEGSIGELASLLERAAVRAIRTGRERIDEDALDNIGWVAPSERKGGRSTG